MLQLDFIQIIIIIFLEKNNQIVHLTFYCFFAKSLIELINVAFRKNVNSKTQNLPTIIYLLNSLKKSDYTI